MEIPLQMASVAERLAVVPAVRAVAVVGSYASGAAVDDSDVDLFIYLDETPGDELAHARAAVVADLAEPLRPPLLGVPGHPYADAWVQRGTDIWVDAMYWTTKWAEDELDWRLVRHVANVGHTTAFWRSIRTGIPLFERDDWHRQLQRRAASPYPDKLRDAILRLNRDLISSENPFSFRHQAAAAAGREDAVAAQHATAKWLASYFDALFAANRVLHPGEKRLIEFAWRECDVLPHRFDADVAALVRLAAEPRPIIGQHMDSMAQRFDSAAARG